MSRKGVITKRVKTVQTALSRKQRPTAQSGWPRNYCFALGQNHIRPSEVSAKVRSHPADHKSRPGNIARGRPSHHHVTPPHTTMPREPGNKASRPRNPFTYHGRCIRPSREDHPRPAEKPSAKSLSADHAGRPCNHPATTVPTRPKTRLSGRSSRPIPTPRSTRSPF
ncbi:unnamed protein product [Microthlaspi erraticum]|uniref:Uncharacterized protein n=1 Tax=Microthlaspi erraticum TaxID=1685480 RepID=A0A6D2JRU4_9BRAS|nr:unnamed protein product [Microthlaspi erraticum]